MRKKEIEKRLYEADGKISDLLARIKLVDDTLKEIMSRVEELEQKVEKRYLSDLTQKEPQIMIPADVLNEYLFGEQNDK